MNNKRLHDKSITEIVMGLMEMNSNMTGIQSKTPYKYYATVAHYVGQNYDGHIEELRLRGQETLANKYAPLADGWRR